MFLHQLFAAEQIKGPIAGGAGDYTENRHPRFCHCGRSVLSGGCTPLIVQLFFVYYGMPTIGVKIDPVFASIVTMGLNSGAYMSENVRGAILSVDKGQYEAAKLLGFNSFQVNRYIVLPQAIRVAIPAFMNGFSTMIKETSMASVLPVIELTKLGNQIYAKTYHPFEIYISLGVLYFVMTYSMTFVARKLERKATKWQ